MSFQIESSEWADKGGFVNGVVIGIFSLSEKFRKTQMPIFPQIKACAE